MQLFRCDPCGSYFESVRALQNHGKTSPRHVADYGRRCLQCGSVYSSPASLIQHYVESPLHYYCSQCNEHFDRDSDYMSHKLYRHNGSNAAPNNVNSNVSPDASWYCTECNLAFQSRSDLYTHWESTTHTTQQYTCPGNDCSKTFGTPSAVIQHLESGACASGMTRQRVNRMAIAADRGAVITDRARIAADNERLSMPEPVATTAWFNGSSYECIICHRTCRTLVGLNRHLRSPAHSEKIFKCPRQWSGCGKAFNTLSGLVQHVESGVCGVRRFTPQLSAGSRGRPQLSLHEETASRISLPDTQLATPQRTQQPIRTEPADYSPPSYPQRKTYAESLQSFPRTSSNIPSASSTNYTSPASSQSNTYTYQRSQQSSTYTYQRPQQSSTSTYQIPQQSYGGNGSYTSTPRSQYPNYTSSASPQSSTYTNQHPQQSTTPTYRSPQQPYGPSGTYSSTPHTQGRNVSGGYVQTFDRRTGWTQYGGNTRRATSERSPLIPREEEEETPSPWSIIITAVVVIAVIYYLQRLIR